MDRKTVDLDIPHSAEERLRLKRTFMVGHEEELIAENKRLRDAIRAIQRATIEGRVCDDVAWFDTITTLHDFCDQILDPK